MASAETARQPLPLEDSDELRDDDSEDREIGKDCKSRYQCGLASLALIVLAGGISTVGLTWKQTSKQIAKQTAGPPMSVEVDGAIVLEAQRERLFRRGEAVKAMQKVMKIGSQYNADEINFLNESTTKIKMYNGASKLDEEKLIDKILKGLSKDMAGHAHKEQIKATEWLDQARCKTSKKFCLAKSLAMDKTLAPAWVELGLAGGGAVQGHTYTARMCYANALRLDGNLVQAWTGMGIRGGGHVNGTSYDRKECDAKALAVCATVRKEKSSLEAKTCLTEALLVKENFTEAWVQLGHLHGGNLRGQSYTAQTCYANALQLDGNLVQAWTGMGLQGGGRVNGTSYDRKECFAKALSLCATVRKEKSPWAWWGWSNSEKAKSPREAKICLTEALLVNENFTDAWVELGHLHGGNLRGQFYEATKCYAMALQHSGVTKIEIRDGQCDGGGGDLEGAGLCPLLQDIRWHHDGLHTLVKVLTQALRSMPWLEELRLPLNGARDKVMEALAEALPGVPKLRELSLDYNKIGDTGMEALAKALPSMPRLRELNLFNNNIGDKGMEALAEALPSVPELRELNLDYNKIGDKGMEALAKALPSMPRLRKLNLRAGVFFWLCADGRSALQKAAHNLSGLALSL